MTRPVPSQEREQWHGPQVLICLGLFFASSDRLLALKLGTLSVKPTYIFMSAAFAIVVATSAIRPPTTVRRALPGLPTAIGVLVLVNVIAAVLARSYSLALQQLVVIGDGAIVPFLAIGFGLRTPRQVDRGITALVFGTLVAATFGFYQLFAPRLGLPQVLAYTGVAGGVSRISGFSYEPAFYVFHLELSLAIAIADVLCKRRRFRVRPEIVALFLIASLVFANARAGYLSFPLLAFLVLRASSASRRFDQRAIRFIRVFALGAVVTTVVGFTMGLNLPTYILERVQSVTNTQEAESNSIRVVIYRAEVRMVADHPWFGYGPGNLGVTLVQRLPIYYGVEPRTIVANNLFLQSILDAGFVSVPGLVAVLCLVYRESRRNANRETRVLLSGATAILLINGMLISLAWDTRLWVVLGLAYAAARVQERAQSRVTVLAPRSG